MITTKNGSYFPIFWEQSLCLRYLYYVGPLFPESHTHSHPKPSSLLIFALMPPSHKIQVSDFQVPSALPSIP